MNPEQQRIAIAEACGITNCGEVVEAWRHGPHNVRLEGTRDGLRVTVPDYLSDLNAMHDAVKCLDDDEYADYSQKLLRLVGSFTRPRYHDATADQRAEALLRTLGKWVES